jgi:hypothetical protein
VPTPSSNVRSIASQTVWLKFEAERNTHDVAYRLIKLRRKLGLPIQLPIHGPGGYRVLQQHLRNAAHEQVVCILIDYHRIHVYSLICSRFGPMLMKASTIV